MGLSCTVSDINSDFSRKSPIFPTPVYLTPQLKGSLGIWYRRKGRKILQWWGYQMSKKF